MPPAQAVATLPGQLQQHDGLGPRARMVREPPWQCQPVHVHHTLICPWEVQRAEVASMWWVQAAPAVLSVHPTLQQL